MKKITHLFTLLTASLLLSCMSDIRISPFDQRPEAKNSQQALEILQKSANSLHKNGNAMSLWFKQSSVEVVLNDNWYGLAGIFFDPHPQKNQKIKFRFLPGKDAGVLEYFIQDKSMGHIKGIHEWNPWEKKPGEKPVYNQSEEIKFMIPTMQYFLEIPFRLAQGKAIRDYGGLHTIGDKEYHIIYMTWGTYLPNEKNDQYVIFINSKTNLIERVDFTVRDKFNFVKSSAFYNDYKQIGKYMLPHLIRIGDSNKQEDAMHDYKISSYKLNQAIKRSDYAPDANKSPSKKFND